MLNLDRGGGPWSCLKMMCQTLSEEALACLRVDRGGVGEGGRSRRTGGSGNWVCKMRNDCLKEILKSIKKENWILPSMTWKVSGHRGERGPPI